ncbi:MAG: UDP-glucuronic acid decarboxylase family protein [Candidatus Neomarinimicrobiota bacterium]
MEIIKKVLVTGGAGFLGTHLCKKLLNKNYKVICVDNYFSSASNNISQFKSNKNFTFIKQDVCDLNITEKIDFIYNLACPASPLHYQLDPVKTVKTNILGALNVLELAKKNNATIFQASTSEVYGDPKISPQNEDYWGNVNPIGVRSCYDEGKRVVETLFFDYHRQYNLNIKVCRIFNTYGPFMAKDDGRVVSNFIIQALKNKNLSIYGLGNQTRSFCFVDDLIDGIIRFMENTKSFTGPLNLGNNYEMSIKDIAQKIIILSNSKSSISYTEALSDDPMQRKPDLTQAKKVINWNPQTSIDEGLLSTIKYFKNII